MRLLKIFTVLVVLGGVGLIAVVTAPSIYGQRDDRPERRSRELSILAGRGASIGVSIRDVMPAEAGGQPPRGVLIDEVRPDSPADKGGMKRGDVVVEFDGEHVRSARQFSRLVEETPPGRTVKATIMRGGQRRDVQITPSEGRRAGAFRDGDGIRPFGNLDQLRELGRLSERMAPFNFNFDFDFPGVLSGRRLGVGVTELTDQLAQYFGARDGVLVTSVTDGSAASRAGLKAGDVITAINGRPVRSREDMVRELRDATGEDVTIGIVRDRKETTVTAKIESEPRRPARGARPA